MTGLMPRAMRAGRVGAAPAVANHIAGSYGEFILGTRT